MIIGTDFVWLHFPKCAGTFTEKLIRSIDDGTNNIEYDPIDPGNVIWHQNIPERENVTGKILREKAIISNFRRLPFWVISRIQFEKNRSGFEVSRDLYRMGCFLERTGSINLADRYLQKYGIPLVNHWIRVEYLKEDFSQVFSKFLSYDFNRYENFFARKINASGWEGGVKDWFDYEDLVALYSSNPNWARLENRLYGNLLIRRKDLLISDSLTEEDMVCDSNKCLVPKYQGLNRIAWKAKMTGLRISKPRHFWFFNGKRGDLNFMKTNLITQEGEKGESFPNPVRVRVTIEPVQQHHLNGDAGHLMHVSSAKRNNEKGKHRNSTIPGEKTIWQPVLSNCQEINMKDVEMAIEFTRDIKDLSRNSEGLAFEATRDAPAIVFREMNDKIPWLALHLDITVPADTILKLFYRHKGEKEFIESHAVRVKAQAGRGIYRLQLPCTEGITGIRIDPGEVAGVYVIHRILAEV
jgi:hypothetical protein